MEQKNFDDVVESFHNMMIMILLWIGVTNGLLAWLLFKNIIVSVFMFVGIWFYPLVANIARRFGKMKFLK